MSPCIEWTRARSAAGYGQTYRDGRIIYTHRLAWERAHGPIPKGMAVCHHCDNPPCMNVEHLFLGTIGDNNRDMRQKGRGGIPPHYRGERNPASRLTAQQVAVIRTDQRVLRLIAADYGVSISTISQVRRGRTWRQS